MLAEKMAGSKVRLECAAALFCGGEAVEFEVEFEDVDAGFAEETELAFFRMGDD